MRLALPWYIRVLFYGRLARALQYIRVDAQRKPKTRSKDMRKLITIITVTWLVVAGLQAFSGLTEVVANQTNGLKVENMMKLARR